ncbi:MAG: FKBP-type peptidyl-prolyl cis-trans isomerase [Bacteroidota bacterium]|nr:FKBP-type peptidyl-prolyl cis-trans isomerase [Bacteroidota bacterium]
MNLTLQKKSVICHLAFVILAMTIFLTSCKDSSKYPGYTEAEPGIYYKLHIPGESDKKAKDEDFYEVRMQNRYAGKVFFDSEFQNASGTMLMQSSASRYFSVLHEGDSATFLLPGGDLSLPGMPDTGMVEMNVKVIRILTADEVQKMERTADPDLDEQVLIRRYLLKNKLDITPDSTGLYYISEKEGTGERPAYGKTVNVIYSGILPTGKPIDGNAEAGVPFSFPYGAEGQVIPGIMKALSHMKAGGKAKIILPSPLAFGENGSSTGIVPPHTPVIYEIELVSVE